MCCLKDDFFPKCLLISFKRKKIAWHVGDPPPPPAPSPQECQRMAPDIKMQNEMLRAVIPNRGAATH